MFFGAQLFYTLQWGRIYYAVYRLPGGLLGPYKIAINTASSFVRCGSTAGCAPAWEREFALTEPTFDCRIWQSGAKWHWQVMNDLEHVLASGVAESNLAARDAVVLQCLQRLGSPSGPN